MFPDVISKLINLDLAESGSAIAFESSRNLLPFLSFLFSIDLSYGLSEQPDEVLAVVEFGWIFTAS